MSSGVRPVSPVPSVAGRRPASRSAPRPASPSLTSRGQVESSDSFCPRAARPLHVAHRPIVLRERRLTLGGLTMPSASGRAHEDLVTLGQDMLTTMVDAATVDSHVSCTAVGAAREAGRREARALGHEAHDDRALRLALDEDVLAETASESSGAARAGTETLVADVDRALPLGHLHRSRRDVAGPRQHVLAVLPRCGSHAAVEEQYGGVRFALVVHARMRD